MALFGGLGVLFNPVKGLVLLKAARTAKERNSNYEVPVTGSNDYE